MLILFYRKLTFKYIGRFQIGQQNHQTVNSTFKLAFPVFDNFMINLLYLKCDFVDIGADIYSLDRGGHEWTFPMKYKKLQANYRRSFYRNRKKIWCDQQAKRQGSNAFRISSPA